VTVTSKNSYHNSFSKLGKIRCGVPQGPILGPLLFLYYINDLTRIVGNNSKPVLFADDTSLIVTHPNHRFLQRNHICVHSIKWMVCSQFIIFKFKKTPQYMYFIIKNISVDEIPIGYNNMFISNTSNIKFLGLVITNSLLWKDHITQLTPKLCKACYVLTCIRPFLTIHWNLYTFPTFIPLLAMG